MSSIDTIFRSNQSSFDSENMPDGHFERFDQRLNALHYNNSLSQFKVYFAVAATVVLFVTILGIVSLGLGRINQSTNYLLVQASPEIQEAERYYRNEIEAKIKIITHQKNVDNTLRSDLYNMNKQLQGIQKDIALNPTDSRIVSAVLNTYISQIELLDVLIEQTKRINSHL